MSRTRKRRNKSTNNSIVVTLLQLLNIVKLYHWNTNHYGEHLATDKIYNELNIQIDKFVEILLGKQHFTISINSLPVNTTQNTNLFLRQINYNKHKLAMLNLDDELANVRDEIVGSLDTLIYLFHFQS